MTEAHEGKQRSARCVVRGRVQGVGYRAWTARQAKQRAVLGSVQNLPDGSVEVLVTGPIESVTLFIQDLHRGPTAASVESVETMPIQSAGTKDFVIIR
jgi:acylphosphatase